MDAPSIKVEIKDGVCKVCAPVCDVCVHTLSKQCLRLTVCVGVAVETLARWGAAEV